MTQKTIYALLAVVAIGVLLFVYTRQIKTTPQEVLTAPTPVIPTPVLPPPEKQPAPSTRRPTPYVPKALPGPLSVMSPAAGEQWAWSELHDVKWNRETGLLSGSVGGIALINAATNETVGWISQGILPRQTSQQWNTREAFLNQTGPLRKDIPTGSYIIQVSFGSGITAKSQIFFILDKEQIQPAVKRAGIQNGNFLPNSLTVKRGDKIVLVNNELIPVEVVTLSYYPLKIMPGESAQVDTLTYPRGIYEFKLIQFPRANFALTVE